MPSNPHHKDRNSHPEAVNTKAPNPKTLSPSPSTLNPASCIKPGLEPALVRSFGRPVHVECTVSDFEFRVWGLGLRVLILRLWGSGFRLQGVGFELCPLQKGLGSCQQYMSAGQTCPVTPPPVRLQKGLCQICRALASRAFRLGVRVDGVSQGITRPGWCGRCETVGQIASKKGMTFGFQGPHWNYTGVT